MTEVVTGRTCRDCYAPFTLLTPLATTPAGCTWWHL